MCYDGDPCDVWLDTKPRARKEHKCDECGGVISPGMRYVRMFSVYDGKGETFKRHQACNNLWRFVQQEVCGGDGLQVIGGLGEEIDEYGSDHEFVYWRPGTSVHDGDEPVNILATVWEALGETYRERRP